MSTLLSAVGPMNLGLSDLSHQAEIILEQLRAYPFKRSLKHDHLTEEEGDWTYSISYYEKEAHNPHSPWVDIDIRGPFCHFPVLRLNNIEIGSFYKYHLMMNNQSIPWFSEYRKELFEICRILNVPEVIYIADQSNFLGGICQAMVWENYPYQEIKDKIWETMGPPTALADAKTFDSYDAEDEAGQWFLDDFADFKAKGVTWFSSVYLNKID